MNNPINHDYAKGEDVRKVIQKIESSLTVMCDVCKGSGKGVDFPDRESTGCSNCGGSGKWSDEDETVVLMACLSLALIIQYPAITGEELAAGVLHTSEAIALFLSSLENGEFEGEIPSNKVN